MSIIFNDENINRCLCCINTKPYTKPITIYSLSEKQTYDVLSTIDVRENIYLLRRLEYNYINDGIQTLHLDTVCILTYRNNNCINNIYLYETSYKEVIQTFIKNDYKEMIIPCDYLYKLSYFRNDIMIINREDTEKKLLDSVDDGIYIIRYKKIDKYITKDTLCVLSYKVNRNIVHTIIKEEDFPKLCILTGIYNKIE